MNRAGVIIGQMIFIACVLVIAAGLLAALWYIPWRLQLAMVVACVLLKVVRK